MGAPDSKQGAFLSQAQSKPWLTPAISSAALIGCVCQGLTLGAKTKQHIMLLEFRMWLNHL